MKRNCCSLCGQTIDRRDFYVESKKGKICSDCLVEAGPIEDECAHLFRSRGPKEQLSKKAGAKDNVVALPLKKAL